MSFDWSAILGGLGALLLAVAPIRQVFLQARNKRDLARKGLIENWKTLDEARQVVELRLSQLPNPISTWSTLLGAVFLLLSFLVALQAPDSSG